MPSRILIVDDDRATSHLLAVGLGAEGHEVRSAASGHDALALATEFEPHVVVTDLNMPGMSGLELCARLGETWPDVPVLVITAFGSMDAAIGAIRAGAFDFVNKPFDFEVLALAVQRAVRHHELKSELKRLRAAVGQGGWGDTLIGASVAIQELRGLLERVAATDTSVLLTGESGTGKEVVARALHAHGRRREGPFTAVNCAAMPEALLESELFGHVKGAFTDARGGKPGLFLEANHGTVFLDEIGDMPLSLQPKLLRALEARCVRPVGATVEVPFDARVIAATNRDLELAIQEQRFRDDLYYRLNVLHVPLPPLRSRGGDVLLLAQHFVTQLSGQMQKQVLGLAPAAAEKLLSYPWPGNVRELRNCIERAIALTRFDHITVEDLPDKVRHHESRHIVVAGDSVEELVSLEEVEKRYILRVLQAAGGNKTLTAQTLGLSRKTLYRKLAAYGVE